MQTAILVSDAVLAAAALAALGLARPRYLAMAGFALLALAAAAGCLRYGGLDAVLPLHQGLSFLAGTLGLPMVLLAYAGLTPRQAAPALAALLMLSAAAWMQPPARLLVGLATLLGWSLMLWRGRRDPVLAGAIAAGIAASLAAGLFAPQGRWPQLEIMHYALALAQLAFGAALHLRYKDHTTSSPTQAGTTGEQCPDHSRAAPPAS
jgi:hypothetical protein